MPAPDAGRNQGTSPCHHDPPQKIGGRQKRPDFRATSAKNGKKLEHADEGKTPRHSFYHSKICEDSASTPKDSGTAQEATNRGREPDQEFEKSIGSRRSTDKEVSQRYAWQQESSQPESKQSEIRTFVLSIG